MKGNKKILAVALLLLLVAVSFGTYAIYRTNVSGNATVKAAKWSVKVKNGTTELSSIALTANNFDCGSAQHGKNGTVAPGDTCTATLTVDLTGSEVDAKVKATVDTSELTDLDTSRFTITTDAEAGSEKSIAYNASSMTTTITITLTWKGDTDNLAENGKDAKDVAMNDKSFVVPIAIEAYQDMGA